jgi:hypothetical protein
MGCGETFRWAEPPRISRLGPPDFTLPSSAHSWTEPVHLCYGIGKGEEARLVLPTLLLANKLHARLSN